MSVSAQQQQKAQATSHKPNMRSSPMPAQTSATNQASFISQAQPDHQAVASPSSLMSRPSSRKFKSQAQVTHAFHFSCNPFSQNTTSGSQSPISL
ncbi:hypothetical protein ACFX1R_042584 [Malus domestica]